MRKLISNLNFSQLKKLEVQTLANRVLTIVEKHDPETLKIKEIFDILLEQKPQIKLLKVGYGPHPVTIPLNDLRKKRNALMQGVIYRLKTIEDAKIRGMAEALVVVKPVVHNYLLGLSRESEETITATVIQFLDFVDENANMATAIETMDLLASLDDLRSVITEIDEHYDNRRENISLRPKMNTRGIVAQLKSDIRDVFKQIEVAQIKNQDLDYNPLIDELNIEIAHYKAIIKTRKSINKKKADNVVDNVEVVDDNQPEEPSEPIQTATRMYPMNAELGNEDIFGEVDKKRTVAVPRKQTLLPDVSTEA